MLGSPSLDERKEGKRNPGFHAGVCSLISFSTLFILPWYLFYQLGDTLIGRDIYTRGIWFLAGFRTGTWFILPKFIEFHFQWCFMLSSCFSLAYLARLTNSLRRVMLPFYNVDNLLGNSLWIRNYFFPVPLHFTGRNVTKFLTIFLSQINAGHSQAYPIILSHSVFHSLFSWSVSKSQRMQQIQGRYKGWSHRKEQQESCFKRTVDFTFYKEKWFSLVWSHWELGICWGQHLASLWRRQIVLWLPFGLLALVTLLFNWSP